MRKTKLLFILVLLMTAANSAIAQLYAPPGGGGVGLSTITLTPNNLTMTVGETTTVTCTVSGGMALPSWRIASGSSYISLSLTGNNSREVTALAPGTATIECYHSGFTSGTCTGTVIPAELTLNEVTDNTAAISALNGKVANVTLARTIKADTWSTFVVPFNIDNATLLDQFGDVEVSAISGNNGEGLAFTPLTGEDRVINANEPVILKVSADKSEFTFNNVTIVKETPTKTVNGANIVGNYGGEKYLGEGVYYIARNELLKSDGTQKIQNFRAYFEAVTPGAKAFFENFSFSEATGVKTIDNGELIIDNAVIYDLQGRRVANPTRGIYVVNGKKVVIK